MDIACRAQIWEALAQGGGSVSVVSLNVDNVVVVFVLSVGFFHPIIHTQIYIHQEMLCSQFMIRIPFLN